MSNWLIFDKNQELINECLKKAKECLLCCNNFFNPNFYKYEKKWTYYMAISNRLIEENIDYFNWKTQKDGNKTSL